MVGSRTLTALAGLAISLVVSVAAYVYFGTLLLFLFVPFVPFLFPGVDVGSERAPGAGPGSRTGAGIDSGSATPVRECPQCGFRTQNDEYVYCPRDGRRLQERGAR